MAGFEGIKWAEKQMRYLLKDKSLAFNQADDKVFSVSRSIHYGIFLAFEGIRFFCKKNNDTGKIEANFLNLDKNIERLQRSMKFNLSFEQQNLVPSFQEIKDIFNTFFKQPEMKSFFTEMAEQKAQGYLRPFTFDEDQSIGVTFPANPSIRAVVCRYDRYLGEPFTGVVVPNLVRAIGVNGTGCLKLGVNYLISLKAIDTVKQIFPEVNSTLFLDDRPYEPVESRKVTEWDTSCCLIALKNNTVIKIPESNLILPSITIQGICTILKDMRVKVEERDITYGELIEKSNNKELIAICSVGTAGILNRAQKLILIDEKGNKLSEHQAEENHELYKILGKARAHYWDIYQEKESVPEGHTLQKIEI
ncbi:MAG: aminotransferase class IV [bacterium]